VPRWCLFRINENLPTRQRRSRKENARFTPTRSERCPLRRLPKISGAKTSDREVQDHQSRLVLRHELTQSVVLGCGLIKIVGLQLRKGCHKGVRKLRRATRLVGDETHVQQTWDGLLEKITLLGNERVIGFSQVFLEAELDDVLEHGTIDQEMVNPPSTDRMCPVVDRESSQARNKAAFATSSGVTMPNI